MNQKVFDPHKFIDRDFEKELFEELLKFKDKARILAIQDVGGMGKSQLLKNFQYRCRTVQPRTPVSMIALDQLGDSSPLALVQEMVKNLASFSLEFPRFEKAEQARINYDFAVIHGHVDMANANLSEAVDVHVGGNIVRSETVQELHLHSNRSDFSPERQAKAQETSIKAFFLDLKESCERQPVVILLDAYERCDSDLQEWLIMQLLELQFFNLEKRPLHLLLVIAGRELLNFDLYWSRDDCNTIVKSIKSLSPWRAEHVEECLRVHGFSYTPEQLEAFVKMIDIGLPPSQVLIGMQTLSSIGAK